MEYSVLKNANKENINLKYFPYIVIENALDEELYNRLSLEYPSLRDIKDSNIVNKQYENRQNHRFNMNSIYAKNSKNVSETWKKFINYHTSKDFWLEILSLFKDEILRVHPTLEKKIGCKLEEINIFTRFSKELNKKEMSLDCQIAMNSPVEKISSVRTTHLDFPNKLFAGLLYMRTDDDDSTGGDLDICKVKENMKKKFYNLKKYKKIPSNFVEVVNTVKYKKNCLVFFINSNDSVHSVTNRSITPHNRRLINIIGEFDNLNIY